MFDGSRPVVQKRSWSYEAERGVPVIDSAGIIAIY